MSTIASCSYTFFGTIHKMVLFLFVAKEDKNMSDRLTGYPSIDKPWLRYYPQENIGMEYPNCNLYDYIWERNKNYQTNNAIEFFGNHITYKKLFEEINNLTDSFWTAGVREGDVVTFIAITSPEIIYSIYALNRLGATCSMLDPRMSDDIILSKIQKTHSRYVILLDIFAEKLNFLTKMETITLFISTFSKSMPQVVRKNENMNDSNLFGKCVLWDDLLHNRIERAKCASSVPERPALIVYTGGTTGEPKGVVLSNLNVNIVANQYERSGTEIKREHSWQTVAAPFITYTLVYSTHMPLSYGMECKIVIYDPKSIAEQTATIEYTHVAGNPLMWESVIRSEIAKNADFSHLIDPTTGADYMSPQLEMEINSFLSQHGCKWKMCQGYGLTEVASAASKNLSNEVNKIGSVGIPFIDMTISAFDPESQQELKYGETGEICISGPSVMLGYYDEKKATDEMIRIHPDGRKWLHSGDLGHVDKDGFVFIDGRLKRMFAAHNGSKIFPPYIERVIMECEFVQRCCVVGINDPNNLSGKIPYAFVVVREGFEERPDLIKKKLEYHCRKKLPEYEVPYGWSFIKNMPVTAANKVDYRVLEIQADENVNNA